jgi:hypothetical protein
MIWISSVICRWFLNSEGHQFHQYQQSEQIPLILTELSVSNKHKEKDQDICR